MKSLILSAACFVAGCAVALVADDPKAEPTTPVVKKAPLYDDNPNPLKNVTGSHRLWLWRVQEGTAVSFSVMIDPDCDCRKCKPKFD